MVAEIVVSTTMGSTKQAADAVGVAVAVRDVVGVLLRVRVAVAVTVAEGVTERVSVALLEEPTVLVTVGEGVTLRVGVGDGRMHVEPVPTTNPAGQLRLQEPVPLTSPTLARLSTK